MYLDCCDSSASLHPHSVESDKGGAPSPRMPVNSRHRSLECKAWQVKMAVSSWSFLLHVRYPLPSSQDKTTDRKLVQ